MKDNLENIFRKQLQNYEEPYNPKAWEEFSAKLGAKTTVKPHNTSVIKWIASIASIVVVISGIYFVTNDNPTANEQPQTPIVSENRIVKKDNSNETEKEHVEDELSLNEKSSNVVEKNDIGEIIEKLEVAEKVNSNQLNISEQQKIINENVVDDNNLVDDKKIVQPIRETETGKQYIIGYVSTNSICLGEQVIIKNSKLDENSIVAVRNNNTVTILLPGETTSLHPESTINVDFLDENNDVIETQTIVVKNPPIVDFSYEANIYENGLPITICKTYGDFNTHVWTFNGVEKSGEATVKHTFFDNGSQEVKLKVIDKNGCENSITKNIEISEKYNLMAVDAFRPNDPDPRNRVFMPFALTQRDVGFYLTIIDPISSEVVFTSGSSENGWDGTDQKTGKTTPSNKSYVWKVQIFNPLPNERPVYTGTVVHK